MERFIRPVVLSNKKLFTKKQSNLGWYLSAIILALFIMPMTIQSVKNDKMLTVRSDWNSDVPVLESGLQNSAQEPAEVIVLAETICNINRLLQRDQVLPPQTRVRVPNGPYIIIYTVRDPEVNTPYRIAEWFEKNREEARKLGPTE